MLNADGAGFVVGRQRVHVLLISPLTFSYHLSICKALRGMGHDVTWWDERASSNTGYKIALRLFPEWTVRWSEGTFLTKLKNLDASLITDVLVVKGEGLSPRVVSQIRHKLADASMGLYLWDGADNVHGVGKIAPKFDSVATFDPEDAKTFGWRYRPLFAHAASTSPSATPKARFDWCFIGTIHSDRHRVIHRLRRRSGETDRSFVYCFFQSPLVLFLRLLTDWTLWLAPRGTLSTVSMPASAVAQVVSESAAVLDIEHPRQRGFTMRTIETLLAGKKLVTTNRSIVNNDLYHPSRVHLINRQEPSIPTTFLAQPFEEIADDLKHQYSCEGWIAELLDMQVTAKAVRSRDAKANPFPK